MARSLLVLLVAMTAACGTPSRPVPPHPTTLPSPSVQPSQRLAGGSLFGTDIIGLPTGVSITPDATPGSVLLELDPQMPSRPGFRAGGAVSVALSPDGNTLLVLTSGYNRTHDGEGQLVREASTEWVFVYDVAEGTAPRPVQAVSVPNAFDGIAFAVGKSRGGPGDRFYVGGGSDDVVREYLRTSPRGLFAEVEPPIPLGHRDTRGLGGLGIDESPYAAGIALTPGGTRLVVANLENDSISVVDLQARKVESEIALIPGGGQIGGEFPYWVSIADETTAYVSCQRDREVVQVDLAAGRVTRRIPVGGEPAKMTLNRAGSRLFVSNANSDSVSIVSLPDGALVSQLRTTAALSTPLQGSNPNDVALSPDEEMLYVSLGGNNALAVFRLGQRAIEDRPCVEAQPRPGGYPPDPRARARSSGSSRRASTPTR